jgi:hypothetical protein
MKQRQLAVLFAVIAALTCATPCFADSIGEAFNIVVTVSAGGAQQSWTIPHGVIDSSQLWNYDCLYDAGTGGDCSVPLHDPSNPAVVLGTITQLGLALQPDPLVRLNFAVQSGNALTPWSLTSAVVPVSPVLSSASGTATVSNVYVEDGDGDNTATLTGLFPGNKALQFRYNNTSVFCNLLSPVSLASSMPASDSFSGPIAGPVSSIVSQYAFDLSANDLAIGTSQFTVTGVPVPEPGSFALLMAGALSSILACVWRRRK